MEWTINNTVFIFDADYRIQKSKELHKYAERNYRVCYFLFEVHVNKEESIAKTYTEAHLPENKPYRENWQLIGTEPVIYGILNNYMPVWEMFYSVLSNIYRLHRIFEFAKTIPTFSQL